MTDFELSWLRPWWLIALLPLTVLVIQWWRTNGGTSDWERYVDVALQPYVIESGAGSSKRASWILFLGWAIAIIILAGPVWEKTEVPVFAARPAVVTLFDLSPSMRLDDVKPDRLSRARFKLEDFLDQSKDMQIGLIAFSERPYVISPLTDDITTVSAFLPSLTPEIMPVQGSRVDLAIVRAVELLDQASVSNGSIFLITDSQVGQRDIDAAAHARSRGHNVSVLAVGTESGAPLRGPNGQFVKSRSGSVVVPQLDLDRLRSLTDTGGGITVKMSPGQRDVDAILDIALRARIDLEQNSSGEPVAHYWVERSPWLLPFVLLASLMLFRRGVA